MPFLASARSPWARIALVVTVVAAAGVAVGSLAFYVTFLRDLPNLERIDDYRPSIVSRVLARDGREIGEFFVERRRLVAFDEIPAHTRLAFVAAEDGGFYQHSGVDYTSILRAALANLRAGGAIRQGASTITQQTVKSLVLSPERTYHRKIREMILARRLEDHFTKDQILFIYLNQIYFGNGAWGIGDAARSYFDKDVRDLSISESALLAGLPQRPSAYSPFRNPDAAERRRRYVLKRMLEDRIINAESYELALVDLPVLATPSTSQDIEAAAYFTELVRRYLFERLGSQLVLGTGLTIETTLDLDLQRTAVAAVKAGLEDHDHRAGYRGPLRHIEPEQIEEEIAALAQQSRLAEPMPLEAPRLPLGQPALGVVTEVDAEAGTARVSFAPGVEGVVHIADVAWARTPDPKRRPRPVKRIADIFLPGDVTRFVPIEGPVDAENEAVAGEPPVALARLGIHQLPIAQGALLSLENRSGDVLALVGGYDFKQSQFDRVTQAKRQPGSAFKPFIYGAALSRGYTPTSIIVDRPVVYVDPVSGFTYKPRNYGRKFYGPISLRRSLAKSVNNATVQLFRDVGVDYVIDYARRLGIQSPLSRDLSLALGSSNVTLLEMTRAYAIFANEGRRVVPRFISRVTDRDGNVLLQDIPLGNPPPPVLKARGDDQAEVYPDGEILPSDQILPKTEAFLMADLLGAVVQEGTGRGVRHLAPHLGGKTGTTNEQADAWFVGFSPDVTTGAWVGHDQGRLLGFGETGARAALPVWRQYMKAALEIYPPSPPDVPGDIVYERVDPETGLLASATTTNAYFQPYVDGTQPTHAASDQVVEGDAARALRSDAF